MRDPLLEFVVKLSESAEPLESDVTLVVGGFLISGFVVSRRKYMMHHPLTKALEDAADADPPDENDPQEPVDPEKRRFIHLRDAKCYVPGQPAIPGNAGMYYRIPISNVSGFSFGLLAPA